MMLCTMTPPPSPPSEHPVVRALQWILEHRTDENGKAYSRRALSLKAGLSAAHVGNILSGAQGADLERGTAEKIARAGNIRLAWLLTGKGPREPFEESDTPLVVVPPPAEAPPPSSAPRRFTEGELDELIREAFIAGRHYPTHADAIREILGNGDTLLSEDASPTDYIRTLFDFGARLVSRGERVSAQAIFRESVRFAAANRARFEPLLEAGKAQGREFLERHGIPMRETPSPALLRALEEAEAPDSRSPTPPKAVERREAPRPPVPSKPKGRGK